MYLLKRYRLAEKHLLIELGIDTHNEWAHYYLALVHKALDEDMKAKESLIQTVQECEGHESSERFLVCMDIIKDSDSENIEFHHEFEELVKEQYTKKNSNICEE